MSGPSSLGRDLTELARAGRLDPVVGRETELQLLLRVLCRRTKNNPLLLGAPGVGKTALVEGLAQRLATQTVPEPLRGRTLFELQLGALLAGTQFRGDLEKRVHDFLQAARLRQALVFIDEVHLLAVAGRGSGMDAANLLKPVLSRGEVPCIGATTPAEAAELFRIDPALERRFQVVALDEPAADGVHAMLRAIRPRLERHHGFAISDGALAAAVELSLTRGGPRKNPDRALDLLEDACAAEQVRRAGKSLGGPSPDLARAREEVAAAAAALDFERHLRARAAEDAAEAEARADAAEEPSGAEPLLAEHVFSAIPAAPTAG